MLYSTEENMHTSHPWIVEGSQKVRIGVHFINPLTDWKEYVATVLYSEKLGFDSVWVADHPTLLADCWTVLSALSVQTSTIRLGSLVSCILYRNPVLLARIAMDVDRMSDGRLVLGMGIGDLPYEFHQLGIPYASVRERQEVLEEALQIIRGLWQGAIDFHGRHFQIQARFPITPLQQPRIPILIAGGGEKTTLRQVACYADVSNFGPHDFTGGAVLLEDAQRKCRVLADHCANIGRDPQQILRSYISMPFFVGKSPRELERKIQALPAPALKLFEKSIVALQPDAVLPYFQNLIQAGMRYFIVGVGLQDRETLELLAEHIPTLNEMAESMC